MLVYLTGDDSGQVPRAAERHRPSVPGADEGGGTRARLASSSGGVLSRATRALHLRESQPL